MADSDSRTPRSRLRDAAMAVHRVYRKESPARRLIVSDAECIREAFDFLSEAFPVLLRDSEFVRLLEAEGFTTVPLPLAKLIKVVGIGRATRGASK
jgi:hypothetical protein